jgi:DNA-binding MarR family transcriptional regulator
MARRFDSALNGIGFSDFMILYHLSQAKEEKMRRVDLAEKVGLTASGVTRLLVPMEKIGLVKRQANKQDARVSFVVLTPVGKRKLTESLEDAEYLAQEVLPSSKVKKLAGISDVLNRLKGVGF